MPACAPHAAINHLQITIKNGAVKACSCAWPCCRAEPGMQERAVRLVHGAHMMIANAGVTPIMNRVPATDTRSPRLPVNPQAPLRSPVP